MFGFKKIDRSVIGRFKKNYLRSVIIQIGFKSNEQVTTKHELFKETFKADFPRFSEQKTHGLRVTFGNDQTPIVQPTTNLNNGFDLRSENGNKQLSCNHDSITLQIAGSEYVNFEQFHDVISKIQKTLAQCTISEVARVAIRKINIIDFNIPDDADITAYQLMEYILNKDLVGSSTAFPNSNSINQNIQILSLAEGHNKLNLKYGFLTESEHNKKGQVLIDIDCIKLDDLPTDTINEELSNINDEVFNIFHWTLSQEAFDELLIND